jgi:hypothetical protein
MRSQVQAPAIASVVNSGNWKQTALQRRGNGKRYYDAFCSLRDESRNPGYYICHSYNRPGGFVTRFINVTVVLNQRRRCNAV